MTDKLLPRDVRKALALMNADPARDHSLTTLAVGSGVAPRTLQKHFRQFLGGTPVTMLRNLRLDLVRRELLNGRADISITGVALRCGFNHLGRFAGWYRARHGETPSETMRRGRRPADPVAPTSTLVIAADRPGIAVLPFRLDAMVPPVAAGIAEEIALALARLRWVHVGSPRTARYHVRGSVRVDATGTLRVIAVLADAATGRHLWADAWSGERDASVMFETRVATGVAAKLQAVLRSAEIARAHRVEPERATAWELSMRALSHAVQLAPPAQAVALELAERAMALAPEDPLPLAIAAWCHGMRAGHNFAPQPGAERDAACGLARRAGQLPARDATAEALLASAYTLAHDLDSATRHVERALALDGGCAWAWQRAGWIQVYRGAADAAIESFQISRTLDPDDPLGFLATIGIAAANFERRHFAEAARWFTRGIAENASAVWANRFLAPAHTLAGDRAAGRASLAALDAAHPGWTIAQVRAALPHTAGFVDRAANALESLGMRP